MAAKGWGGSIATAIGVAAGAGAAQLGLGYGLGIVAWLPAADGASEAAWVASLAWAAWIAATSTIIGAIIAQRISAPGSGGGSGGSRPNGAGDSRPDGSGGSRPDGSATRSGGDPSDASAHSLTDALFRIALAVAAAMGALVTVALVAVPARAATRADTFSPQTIAAGYAVIGVLLGLFVAIWALYSPAVAGNIIGTVCWLWLLAVIAVITGVVSGRGLGTAQLGVWQITTDGDRFWFRDYFYWPGAALALGSALLIGVVAARPTAGLPESRVGAAISGVVGPFLVAAAYFLAAPRLVGIRAEQLSAHLVAPYAVIAGLAGSALVAALAQRRELATRPSGPGLSAAGRYPTDQDGSGQGRLGQGGSDQEGSEQGGSSGTPTPGGGGVPTSRRARSRATGATAARSGSSSGSSTGKKAGGARKATVGRQSGSPADPDAEGGSGSVTKPADAGSTDAGPKDHVPAGPVSTDRADPPAR